jgi:hypothetical protein
MNYTQTLETLRKKISTLDISEKVASNMAPPRPTGFVPQIARSRGAEVPVPQAQEYQPSVVVEKTYQSLLRARRDFEKRVAESAKLTEEKAEETSSQLRPQVRPFNAQGGGFMTRPMSREDAIMNRTAFDDTNRPSGPAGSVQPLPEEQAVMQAIKDIESSGGNYRARGPVVESGRYAGERAMGAYQVMPGNLPQWSMQALGREVSEAEFMRDEEIQDAIFLDQMRRNRERHGTWEDAASVWFSGVPVADSVNRSDGYMSAPDYVRNFSAAYNRYSGG